MGGDGRGPPPGARGGTEDANQVRPMGIERAHRSGGAPNADRPTFKSRDAVLQAASYEASWLLRERELLVTRHEQAKRTSSGDASGERAGEDHVPVVRQTRQGQAGAPATVGWPACHHGKSLYLQFAYSYFYVLSVFILWCFFLLH